MTKIWKTINILLVAGILSIGLLLVGTMMPIPGNYKVKIVKSGSMEPVIRTGGIVVIKPETEYKVGDVVTFGKDTKTQIPTTHRIVEIGDSELGASIRTKGDANNSEDPSPTSLKEVSGKVIFTMPYVGYLLDFARKPIGFGLLVGLPALAVIIDEVSKIFTEIRRLRRKKNGGESMGNDSSKEFIVSLDALPKREVKQEPEEIVHPAPPIGLTQWQPKKMVMSNSSSMLSYSQLATKRTNYDSLPYKVIIALLLPTIFLASSTSIGNTVSYFSDIESSINNFLKADPLGFVVTLSGSSQIDMSTGTETVVPIFTPNSDSEPIQYSLSTYMTGGDTTLCSLILAESTSTFIYSGPLLLLSTQMTTTTGALPFSFSLPSGYSALPNTSCFVDLIFTGRNADAKAGEGYSYTQKLAVQFYIPSEPAPIETSKTVSRTGTASDTPPQIEEVQIESAIILDTPEETSAATTTPPASEIAPEVVTASSTDNSASIDVLILPVVPETPTTTDQSVNGTPPSVDNPIPPVETPPAVDATPPPPSELIPPLVVVEPIV